MKLNLPQLEEGRIYHREEVAEYIGEQDGSCNFNVMMAHFPRSLETWQDDRLRWRHREEILLQGLVPPIMSRQAGARVCRNSLCPGRLRLLRLVRTGMIVGGTKLAHLVVA